MKSLLLLFTVPLWATEICLSYKITYAGQGSHGVGAESIALNSICSNPRDNIYTSYADIGIENVKRRVAYKRENQNLIKLHHLKMDTIGYQKYKISDNDELGDHSRNFTSKYFHFPWESYGKKIILEKGLTEKSYSRRSYPHSVKIDSVYVKNMNYKDKLYFKKNTEKEIIGFQNKKILYRSTFQGFYKNDTFQFSYLHKEELSNYLEANNFEQIHLINICSSSFPHPLPKKHGELDETLEIYIQRN